MAKISGRNEIPSSRRMALPLAAWLLVVPAAALAEAPSLEVTGALPKPGKLTVKDLEALKPEKATWTNHGKAQEVEGVPLGRVLVSLGFESGPMGKDMPAPDKRPGYKKVVRVTARDGFQSVFSCAELMEDMGPTRALLVWKIDGKPLPANEAPFRLIVLTDKEPSRSSWAVQKIEVLDLRTRAP